MSDLVSAATRSGVVALAPRLFAGPDLHAGPEPLESHSARMGPRPLGRGEGGERIRRAVGSVRLGGRGGGGFPVAAKWASIAHAVVVAGLPGTVIVNANEGEPASAKDRALLELRPHLVIDGAMIAAECVGANEVFVVLHRGSGAAGAALATALWERRQAGLDALPVRVVSGPGRYIAGESSAVVALANGEDAKPTFVSPRKSGIGGRPTLVHNAESLAQAALVAYHGDEWFSSVGTESTPGTLLVTVTGWVRRPGTVVEVTAATPLRAALEAAGGPRGAPGGVLIGGYAGRWLPGAAVEAARIDPPALARLGTPIGCGLLGVLPTGACPLVETARIVAYLAGETAGQCGPCFVGLPAISGIFSSLARGKASRRDLQRLQRWCSDVSGRGACHHPDGTIGLVRSTLDVFAADVEAHRRRGPCADGGHPPVFPVPTPGGPWR